MWGDFGADETPVTKMHCMLSALHVTHGLAINFPNGKRNEENCDTWNVDAFLDDRGNLEDRYPKERSASCSAVSLMLCIHSPPDSAKSQDFSTTLFS